MPRRRNRVGDEGERRRRSNAEEEDDEVRRAKEQAAKRKRGEDEEFEAEDLESIKNLVIEMYSLEEPDESAGQIPFITAARTTFDKYRGMDLQSMHLRKGDSGLTGSYLQRLKAFDTWCLSTQEAEIYCLIFDCKDALSGIIHHGNCGFLRRAFPSPMTLRSFLWGAFNGRGGWARLLTVLV